MNDYYARSIAFQKELIKYASSIFQTYGRELVLRLEEYNLLQNKNNCIESSTAIGFVLEEFIVSKLEMYTHCAEESYRIDRFIGSTTSESYDCFAEQDNVRYLVNIKAEKSGVKNNAIAAISQLHKNYCLEEPQMEKNYVVLKVRYSVKDAYEDSAYKRAKPRHLYIDGLESFCIEEIDFSNGHQQDNRSWSETKKTKNNGRLIVSQSFREKNRLPEEEISYQRTFQMLSDIVSTNN
ncbi:UpaP162 family type II restriction enzyme [uncultured Porphyromonas sp.]|uniref:UpaP162 family type II restriction enzyme n=1 Tax=uncultured Porphyromonas sp. TaxID=159274 RepID=UPI0025E75B49|nr:hypothetical protein [uncultured Porphyromonas sp.]